jgi:AI-2 transport protein TqsA
MSQKENPAPAIPPEGLGTPERSPGTTSADKTAQIVDSPAAVAGRSRGLIGTPTGLLIAMAAAAIVIYAMHYASGVLSSIFLAMFITMGATPALNWMKRKGLKSWMAVTVVLLVLVILGVLFLTIMAASVSQLNDKLPVYEENLGNTMDGVSAWFSDRGIDIGGLVSGAISPPKIMTYAAALLGSVLHAMNSLVLMILIALFMISAAYSFPETLREKLKLNSKLSKSFDNFGETTRSFLWTKTWLSFIMAVVVTIIYFAFGVDFAILWGLLFFILSYVPNIGFVLSVIPVFFITLLEFGFTRAVIVIIIVIVMNSIVDNLLSPRIMGKSVGLSSLTIFLSVVFWGWILGGIGALISVPLALMVKLLFFDSYDSTRILSEMMSEGVTGASKRKKKEAAAA